MPDWTALYNRLTTNEKLYLVSHPNHIGTIKTNADKAYVASKAKYPAWSQEDGPGDAFRHAYASALLARDLGVSNAYTYTDAHEAHDPPTDPERKKIYEAKKSMDLYNNNQGVHAFLGMGKTDPTDEELAEACKKLLDGGRLKVIVKTDPDAQ